jgi:hypothetical protein
MEIDLVLREVNDLMNPPKKTCLLTAVIICFKSYQIINTYVIEKIIRLTYPTTITVTIKKSCFTILL